MYNLKRLLSFNKKMYSQNFLNINQISYINAELSKQIDEEMMGKEMLYVTEQLMEIAGQSIALSIHDVIENEISWKGIKNILTISGPGSMLY